MNERYEGMEEDRKKDNNGVLIKKKKKEVTVQPVRDRKQSSVLTPSYLKDVD